MCIPEDLTTNDVLFGKKILEDIIKRDDSDTEKYTYKCINYWFIIKNMFLRKCTSLHDLSGAFVRGC